MDVTKPYEFIWFGATTAQNLVNSYGLEDDGFAKAGAWPHFGCLQRIICLRPGRPSEGRGSPKGRGRPPRLNSQGSGPWLSPNHKNLCGLVTPVAPNPMYLLHLGLSSSRRQLRGLRWDQIPAPAGSAFGASPRSCLCEFLWFRRC